MVKRTFSKERPWLYDEQTSAALTEEARWWMIGFWGLAIILWITAALTWNFCVAFFAMIATVVALVSILNWYDNSTGDHDYGRD